MQAHGWSPPTGALGALVAAARKRVDGLLIRQVELEAAAVERPRTAPMAGALRGPSVAVIAEIKRRSPSKGPINPSLDAATQARLYEAGGASAISVLTESTQFGGSPEDLRTVVGAARIPVLRKDFHVHPIQLIEARALGAAAVLLIVRALPPNALKDLLGVAAELALDAIVEVRDVAELDRALGLDARIIGVNNRDLETLRIDSTTAERLIPTIPADRIAIAESGLRSAADVAAVAEVGADAVLIGSWLSGASDPSDAIRALTFTPTRKRDA